MPPKPSSVNTTEIGATGLQIFSGTVSEEFLTALAGTRAVRAFTEMRDNDPTVGSVLFAIDQLLKQVDWVGEPNATQVEDGIAKPEAQKQADFLTDAIDDMEMSWVDTVSEILSMLPFGWSWHELVYKKREDGLVGWRKWPIRAQESLVEWDVDEHGTIRGMVQQPAPTYKRIHLPIEKSLLFRTSVFKNNPEGRSILRNAYRPWFYKKSMEEIEAIGVERDLAGLPVMYLPVDMMKDDAPEWMKAMYEDAKELVVNIRRDSQEGVILPFLVDPDTSQQTIRLELLSSGGSRSFDTNQIIERYDRRIAMTVLADFILLGHSNVGSFALSSDKTDLFAVTLGAILRNIRDVVNRFAIPRLMLLNGVAKENWPTIQFGDIENQSLLEVSGYLQSLVAAGVPLFPDEGLSEHLLRLANLPKPKHSLEQGQDERGQALSASEGQPGAPGEGSPAGEAGPASLEDAIAQELEGPSQNEPE